MTPWRTTNVFAKIRHCADGATAAFKESSLKYCAALDTSLVLYVVLRDGSLMNAQAPLLAISVELLNAAIERAVDRVGIEYHELAKESKDIAAAASMVAHVSAIAVSLL